MSRVFCLCLLPALLAVAACGSQEPPAPEATTAAEVADRMVQRFESNVGAVDAFTVYAAGVEGRYEVTGDSTDRVRLTVGRSGAGAVPPSAQLLDSYVPNVARLARGLRGAEFGGKITRNGRPAYVLSTDDPGAIVGQSDVPMAGRQRLRLYVDPETYDVLEIYQSFSPDSLGAEVTSQYVYSDFRTTDGLTLPFSVSQLSSGLDLGVSDQQKMVQGGQLGLARSQITEQMPPGPEKDAKLAEIDAQLRMINDGELETTLVVDRIEVGASGG